MPGIELTEIMQFITRSPAVPVIGFEEKLQRTFVHGCVSNCKCFPTASTCDLLLRIPVHLVAIEDFKTSFQGGGGFEGWICLWRCLNVIFSLLHVDHNRKSF